jgi:hypothetical protein
MGLNCWLAEVRRACHRQEDVGDPLCSMADSSMRRLAEQALEQCTWNCLASAGTKASHSPVACCTANAGCARPARAQAVLLPAHDPLLRTCVSGSGSSTLPAIFTLKNVDGVPCEATRPLVTINILCAGSCCSPCSNNYLEITRCYKAIYEMDSIQADPDKWASVSQSVGQSGQAGRDGATPGLSIPCDQHGLGIH